MNNMNNKKPKVLRPVRMIDAEVDPRGLTGFSTKNPMPNAGAKKLPKPKKKITPTPLIRVSRVPKDKRKITPANPTKSIPKPLPILSDSIEKGIKKGLNNYKR